MILLMLTLLLLLLDDAAQAHVDSFERGCSQKAMTSTTLAMIRLVRVEGSSFLRERRID